MSTVDQLRFALETAMAKDSAAHGFNAQAPTVFMGAGSQWSGGYSFACDLHGDSIEKRLPAFAGKVGAYPRWYVPFRADRFRYAQLSDLKRRFPGLQVVDFSADPRLIALHERVCSEAGVRMFTFIQAMDTLDLTPVYETPKDVRAKTIANMDRFMRVLNQLEDEQSRVTLLSVLLHRVTLDRRYVDAVLCDESLEYFSTKDHSETLNLGDDETLCDLGAAKGEVIRKFVRVTGSKYGAIHAFEPDRINFRRLEEIKKGGVKDLHLHNVAMGAERGTTRFLETGSYASHVVETGGVVVNVIPLDDVVDKATFIKMDIEGAEPDAVKGAANVIGKCKPKMAVCVYHYATDLLRVAEFLPQIRPDYKFKLRQHSPNLWDTILYAY